jgi:hypothetical protein
MSSQRLFVRESFQTPEIQSCIKLEVKEIHTHVTFEE